MRRWLVFPVAVLVACASGCSLADDDSARKLLDVIVANHIGELTWAIAWRSLVGSLLGLALGLAVFFGVRQLSGFRWNWEHAKWVRAMTGTIYGVTFAGALGWFGFWQGMQRGSEQVVIEGQIGTDVLPVVGEAGATLLAVVYVGGEVVCEQDRPIDDEQAAMLARRIEGHVADEWQMDVGILRARIADVRGCVLATGIDEAKRRVYERYPKLAGTVADDMVPWVLDRLADQLVASLAKNDQVGGFAKPIVDMLAGLERAARRDGNPDLSHRELSEHMLTTAVVPMVMMPIEHGVKGQKQAGWFAMLGLLVLSIGLFQLAHHLYERRRSAAITTG